MKEHHLCTSCLKAVARVESVKMADILQSPWVIVDKATVASCACTGCKTQRPGMRYEVTVR